jgi:predicted AAA+ superfamily ATPase
MERSLYADLVAWKTSPRRKPLLLRGARQTGKTFLLRQFGDREYERIVYCNFEEDRELNGFFRRDLDPHRILAELSVYKGFDIERGRHLIIFDEVQASDRALTSLKYFQEKGDDYHVVAAGSLLGIKMSKPGSFPVGKVSFLDLHPMSFLEFLRAMGKPRYAELLMGLAVPEPLPDAIHSDLIGLLRAYYFVGGMPEAVRNHAEAREPRVTRQIQREIIDSYLLDFAKHAPATDIPKLGLIWESIPMHLAKENKKFMFSAVKKGARARGYEDALQWLRDAGLVHFCYSVSTSRPPLKHYADRSIFKVYALDVGLLGAMARSAPELAVQGDQLFVEYRGALVENYVAQELVSGSEQGLYYWRSSGGKAEVDFLCEIGRTVAPVEVKAGLNPRSKSLSSYDRQFAPDVLLRSNLLNLKKDGKICNIPLYAVSRYRQIVERTMSVR